MGKSISPGSVPFSSHIAVTVIKSVMVCSSLSDLAELSALPRLRWAVFLLSLVQKVWLFLGEDILKGVGLDICF